MARQRIGDKPMTAAERKRRSRTLALGGVLGHLQSAEELVQLLRHREDRPDLVEVVDDIELHLALAKELLPGS